MRVSGPVASECAISIMPISIHSLSGILLGESKVDKEQRVYGLGHVGQQLNPEIARYRNVLAASCEKTAPACMSSIREGRIFAMCKSSSAKSDGELLRGGGAKLIWLAPGWLLGAIYCFGHDRRSECIILHSRGVYI